MSYVEQDQFRPLIVGIPKNGRLNAPSVSFITEKTGLDPQNDTVNGVNFMFLREKDIAKLLAENVIDVGIVGQNSFAETFCNNNDENVTFTNLNFGKCRLSIAVPNESTIESVADLQAKNILTSYPKQLTKFLADNEVYSFSPGRGDGYGDTNPRIKVYEGGLEEIARLTNADAICDIVETGRSLYQAGMRELLVVNDISAGLCYRETALDDFSNEAVTFLQKLSVVKPENAVCYEAATL